MFRKVYKVCFYILFILMLLAVLAGSVICFMYGAESRKSEYMLYGVLTLVGGVILTFVLFAFNGMIIEAAEDLAAIRAEVAPKQKGRAAKKNAYTAPTQAESAPVQPVYTAPVQPVAETVAETVVETREAAPENEALK